VGGASAYRHVPPRHHGREHARTIEELGGEYRWQTRVDDIELGSDAAMARSGCAACTCMTGSFLEADHVVSPSATARARPSRCCTGAASYRGQAVLHRRAHRASASWVDRRAIGSCAGHPDLGAAAYSLAHHCANGRTVYSFCMCPGGRVVAATSEEGRVVTNGMSQYSRAEFNANSGLVVGIDPARDYPGGPLAGIDVPAPLGIAGL
jgi:uncharacterized FAD-dependent dehydrogenase